MQHLRRFIWMYLVLFACIIAWAISPVRARARDSYKNCYYYNAISTRQKNIYKKTWESPGDISFQVSGRDYSLADVRTGMMAFMLDFPECEYQEMHINMSSRSAELDAGICDEDNETEDPVIYSVDFKKSATRDENAIDNAVNALSAKVAAYARKHKDERDVLKNIHDTVCRHLIYASSESATLYDAVINKRTQCGGYAKLFNVLCRKNGFQSVMVFGKVSGYHAWNMVKLSDGNWYVVDCCFDDTNPYMDISHEYFLKGSSDVPERSVLLDKTLLINSETVFYEDLSEIFPAASRYGYANVGEEYTDDSRKGKYLIKNYTDVWLVEMNNPGKVVKIPSKVKISGKSYQVTGLDEGCFIGEDRIEKITYAGRNRTGKFVIGSEAFRDCKRLKVINLKKAGRITKVGKNAITGCPKLKKIATEKVAKKYRKYITVKAGRKEK